MAVVLLLVSGAYLLGSIPTANIAARLFGGVDLRRFGSGSITSSNVGQLLGKKVQVVVGVLDGLKGMAPVWVAQALGLGIGLQLLAGGMAVVGHNWCCFLKFEGGRGLATAAGVVLAAAPWQGIPIGATIGLGVLLFRNVPLMMGVGVVTAPVWGMLWEQSPSYVQGLTGIVLVLLAKRLAGNRSAKLPAEGKGSVFLYRLLYDRDIKDRRAWVKRASA